jgi:hypothetical protein
MEGFGFVVPVSYPFDLPVRLMVAFSNFSNTIVVFPVSRPM